MASQLIPLFLLVLGLFEAVDMASFPFSEQCGAGEFLDTLRLSCTECEVGLEATPDGSPN